MSPKQPIWAYPLTILCMSAVALAFLGICGGIGWLLPGRPPANIAAPPKADAAAVAAGLDRAAKAQGVCYGWRLMPESRIHGNPLSVGSSAGDGVSVRTAAACGRWLEVVAYTSPTSRRSKVTLSLIDSKTPPDRYGERRPEEIPLSSVGLTEDGFLTDAGAGVLRAATALPRIASEKGIAARLDTGAAQPR